jgi:hypothetical protein
MEATRELGKGREGLTMLCLSFISGVLCIVCVVYPVLLLLACKGDLESGTCCLMRRACIRVQGVARHQRTVERKQPLRDAPNMAAKRFVNSDLWFVNIASLRNSAEGCLGSGACWLQRSVTGVRMRRSWFECPLYLLIAALAWCGCAFTSLLTPWCSTSEMFTRRLC